METIFTQLQKAREAKGLSLADVSSTTNISIEFLKAIENGNTTILPQAYVRAFLREFASVVGLDPRRIMEEYDNQATKPEKTEPAARRAPDRTSVQQPPEEDSGNVKKNGARSYGIAAVVAVIVLGGILYWNYSRPTDRAEVRTEPVRRDQNPPPVEPTPEPTTAPEPEKDDSLHLNAQTSDTVWVQVVIDSRDSLNYVLYPNATRTWRAENSFRVSVGRPEAVQFTLNNVTLGTLGPRSRIVRNNLIDRSTLARIRKQD